MNKKIVLVLVITLLAAFAFVACDQSAEYLAMESKLPDRVYAVENAYEISYETVVKFGKDVNYPLMTKMENLSKSRVINGALSTRGVKIGSDTDGNPGMVFDSYEVLFQTPDLLSIKFYAADKMNAQDESVNFLFAAGKDGKLFMNVANIFGKSETNTNMDALFSVFNSYRELQGMEEITLNEFYFAVVAFKGDDAKTMDIIISYLKTEQNEVIIPFAEVIDYLLPEDVEFFAFAN
ncbi:MAG: hypothetical protein JXQ23_06685 [Clostridia bacterium]|nr:hypothetical protein [Clostridia bacterium]